MHDLIHDLAQYVSRGHYFTLDDGNSGEVTMKVRHLVVASHVSDRTLDSILKTTHLRTVLPSSSNSFHCLSNKAVNDIVSKLTVLRVLNLSWCKNLKELPEKIGDLKHLRSLDLSNTLVERLPKSVTKLYNIQILNLSRCQKLTQLPDDMHRLVNLQHLDIAGCDKIKMMPKQIGKLKSLQTLTTFIVGKNGGAEIGELGELSELRGSLSLQNLENVANAEDASKARLANKKKLEELTFSWSRDTKDPARDRCVLEKLLRGIVLLKRLNIIGYGGADFPAEAPSASLTHIEIKNWQNLESFPLHSFPKLTHVYLAECESLKHFKVAENSFSPALARSATCALPHSSGSSKSSFPAELLSASLTLIDIKNCQNLESFALHSFPNLTHLDIEACEKLKNIAVDEGNPLSLGSLFIKGCQNLISFIGEGLKDCNLNSLTVDDCKKLKKLPDLPRSLKQLWIVNCPEVESFPAVSLHSNLNGLLVDKCSKLTANLMEWNLQKFETLEFFDIRDESDAIMERFPKQDLLPSSLTSLRIGPLKSLKELDMMQLQHFNSLKSLDIQRCPNLTALKAEGASEAPNLEKLRSLFINDCQLFTSFPEIGLNAPCLNSFTVQDCKELKELPRKMHVLFPSLERLWIIDCPNMESFPKEGLPSKLNGLMVSNCTSLIRNQNCWDLQALKVLEFFDIRCDKSCADVELFPGKFLLPSSLTWLSIGPLASLQKLEDLRPLTSLKSFFIKECPKLKELSQLPASLTCLTINKCDSLERRCQREKGEHWNKISHIPRIHIDDKPI